MKESVNTGGTVSFVYDKGKKYQLSSEQKKEIEDAWKKHYVRKEMERKNRIKLAIIISSVILIGFLVWRFLIK